MNTLSDDDRSKVRGAPGAAAAVSEQRVLGGGEAARRVRTHRRRSGEQERTRGVAEAVLHDIARTPSVVELWRAWQHPEMRVCRQFILFSGLLVACGDEDGTTPTTTTLTTMTSVSASMTASMNPSGDTGPTDPSGDTGPTEPSGDTTPTESSDSSETNQTSDESTSAPLPGAPVFLSLQTNVSKVTAGESVTFTAVLTDPDGVEDIVGGTLSDQTGMIGYGPFVAAGQEGTYSIMVSWDAMNQAETIQFEGMDLARVFRAEFYDQAANKVSKDANLTLTCAEGSACDGVCTDLASNDNHCGTCGHACDAGCSASLCKPKFGGCIDKNSGFATCDAYCGSVGESCVENGCGMYSMTIRAYSGPTECAENFVVNEFHEPCDKVRSWAAGEAAVKCCCTDTQ